MDNKQQHPPTTAPPLEGQNHHRLSQQTLSLHTKDVVVPQIDPRVIFFDATQWEPLCERVNDKSKEPSGLLHSYAKLFETSFLGSTQNTRGVQAVLPQPLDFHFSVPCSYEEALACLNSLLTPRLQNQTEQETSVFMPMRRCSLPIILSVRRVLFRAHKKNNKLCGLQFLHPK